jgi:alpha-mannosidase
VFPHIAYNVDSFGHAATLPGLMRAFGQDRYIMMRPQEHEMPLPSRLFRWRGYEDGPEVVTFRIARAYNAWHGSREHIEAALTELPPGIEDTMCFLGVGDHGGGPTETQIAWIREHQEAFPGHRLVFSSPRRFFDAIAPQAADLPLVTGELQQHAIGCYSVYRPIKVAVQKAEHSLDQAEILLSRCGVNDTKVSLDNDVPSLNAAWERVCFAHFHDTLGGTSLPSAYAAELDRLGFASSVAEETAHIALRRLLAELPDDQDQRIVLFNPSRQSFDDFVEFEPWLAGQEWKDSWSLLDHNGQLVPLQTLPAEALTHGYTRLLFRACIEPGGWSVFRIVRGEKTRNQFESCEPSMKWTATTMSLGEINLPIPQLQLIMDDSDTWSHGLDRFGDEALHTAALMPTCSANQGPIMQSWMHHKIIGESSVQAEWRTYTGASFVELCLRIHWREKHRLLKLVWPLDGKYPQRCDGISGGRLTRVNDGRELPIRDWMHFSHDEGGIGIGVLCPDVFAADATPDRLRLTLLRSALMAHHEPHTGEGPNQVVSDQGEHTFRFRFYAQTDASHLDAVALMLHQPPLAADLTRGMPCHLSEIKAP